MQIQKNKNNELEIKTKKAVVLCDHQIKVNDVVLEGAGEYEIGGITIEGIADNLYLFRLDDLVFGLVDFKEKITKDLLEKMSSSEVLLVRLDGNLSEAVGQAGQIEANIVIYAGASAVGEKLKADGVSFKEVESLKIDKADTTDEEAYFIPLENAPKSLES